MTVGKAKTIPVLAIVVATSGSAQVNYYEAEWPPSAPAHAMVSRQLKPTQAVVDSRVAKEDHAIESGPTRIDADHVGDRVGPGTANVFLPARMDKGLAGLVRSIDEAKDYSVATAKHIQQHGLRGYMATTPELMAQGEVIGHSIGESIGDVMVEVGKEMIEDGKHR